jgi:hypothetical protein
MAGDNNAQTAIWDIAGQQPQVQARSFAMMHGAIYDAVNAIAGTPYQPYLIAPAANGTESTNAAVATAAFRVLNALLPAQQVRLQTQYDESLAAIPDGTAKQRGVTVGSQAAAAMIAERQNDGAFGSQTWTVGTEPGQWRPAPPTFASDGAWVGYLKPFLIPSASMFRTSGPPSLTSYRYTGDFNEVKAIGSANSTVRTEDQTRAAIYITSGHACFTAASMSALAYFFGRDDISFSGYSAASGTTRYFSSFSQALVEVINARVWGGIHTRTADVQGAKIGGQVTAYMVGHYFRPMR